MVLPPFPLHHHHSASKPKSMARNPTLVAVLKLSMAAVSAAWACVWILKPTQLWKRWWHVAEDWGSTTFLGDTGLNVVVLCLPLLAVATLGYIYLHLCSKEMRIGGVISHSRRRRIIASFSNPIIVDCPIGMLLGIELISGALFVVFLAWTYYSNIASDFSKLAPYKSLKLNRWQLRVMHAGVRLGSLSEACLALLLLPVLRGMSVFRIFGIQFEASVRYHVWIGNAMILFSILHGMTIMFLWSINNSLLKEVLQMPKEKNHYGGEVRMNNSLQLSPTPIPRLRIMMVDL